MDVTENLNIVGAEDIMENEAVVILAVKGQMGEMVDSSNKLTPIPYDASNENVLEWIGEAVRSGNVRSIEADSDLDLKDYVVDRMPATADRPYNMVMVYPKTPFGQ